VLPSDATRQVRTVTSTAAKSKVRDHTRAMPRSEPDHVIRVTLAAASELGVESVHDASSARQQTSHSLQEREPGSTTRGAYGGRTSTSSTDASTCAAQGAKPPTAPSSSTSRRPYQPPSSHRRRAARGVVLLDGLVESYVLGLLERVRKSARPPQLRCPRMCVARPTPYGCVLSSGKVIMADYLLQRLTRGNPAPNLEW
jgi:hypothetical protein